MSKLPVEVKDFPFLFFVNPRLVEFSRTGSFMLKSYKTGLIFALLLCCFTICSDMQSFHLEVDKFRQHFKRNYYPVTFIDQFVTTFLNKVFIPKRILITS